MVKIACVMLTLNEEVDVQQCLRQFRPHVDYILVLDGGSTDGTVVLAKEIADSVAVMAPTGSFASNKNHAWTLLPKDIDWVLWPDVDEKWDADFLVNMKKKCVEAEKARVYAFRFPRINLPDCKNWPDYQLRFIKNKPSEFEWRGDVHDVMWWKKYNIPVDQADREGLEGRFGIGEANNYPIIHLKRAAHKCRGWW